MPIKNKTLHGNVPEQNEFALLIIDVFNDFDFSGGEKLYPFAVKAVDAIVQLKKRCRGKQIPVVYINDNFGRWQSDFSDQINHCLSFNTKSAKLVQKLLPDKSIDYYVLKPKHSAFYATPLGLLLKHLQTKTIILTGFTTESCILFTAADAYLRDYSLIIPKDCVASKESAVKKWTLQFMQQNFKANIDPSDQLPF